ncbi:MAG: hypothetical protein V1850_07755 [Candidatus Bathyarchaeota archaeon]
MRRFFLKYRKFGKLNGDVSALGFGGMRLPTVGEQVGGAELGFSVSS